MSINVNQNKTDNREIIESDYRVMAKQKATKIYR